jgi:hypothetical protein
MVKLFYSTESANLNRSCDCHVTYSYSTVYFSNHKILVISRSIVTMHGKIILYIRINKPQ